MTNKPDLKKDVNGALNDIKQVASHKYAEAKDKVIHLANDASEKTAEVKEYITEKSQQVKDSALKAEKTVTTYVKKNPWKAIGISAAAGLVLAKILRFGRK